ncbi:MAG TPA: dTMP kinase [Chloroflexota bacterium]
MSGLFLAFEGPDGSGKSTQAQMLASALRARGHSVVETREPGGTPVGEMIRPIILNTPMTARSMAFLLSASRAQLIDDVIEPALNEGHIVIADRFADSTMAYQAYGMRLAIDDIRELTRIATRDIAPRMKIYVDVPVELGLERTATRGSRNLLDSEDLAFHRRVRDGYLELIQQDPENWLVVDGSRDPDQVHAEILRAVTRITAEASSVP